MKAIHLTILISALAALCCSSQCQAQQSVNVLFVGNSYTEVNNLPQMVQQIATSMGDQLTYQSNTPGGCTFSQHCTNHSMELICQGGWDIVVLQEQSQYPSFPQEQVEAEVFPYAEHLVDSAYVHSPCCEPMFYMTWGRKNGDAGNAAEFPILGTYEGMDSMLCARYTYMAQYNDASLCPVGRVWRYLRENHADIELYLSDGSHPSMAGSYAAACAFYAMFFHRDPDSITYDASLPAATAKKIRKAAHHVVYENLSQWQRPKPQALFVAESYADSTALFTSSAQHADSLTWFFGDGSDTIIPAGQVSIIHRYADTGRYTVTLVASRHCMTDTFHAETIVLPDTSSIPPDTTLAAIQTMATDLDILVYPNPTTDCLNISLPENLPITEAALYTLEGRKAADIPVPSRGVCRQIGYNLTALPSGVYLLRIVTPVGTVVQKTTVIR